MARRNPKREAFEPLDLTPEQINRDRFSKETPDEYAERKRRQRNARLNGGIDWAACLVVGCDRALAHASYGERDHTLRLPLCSEHLSVAAAQADKYHRNDPEGVMAAAITRFLIYREAREEAARQGRIKQHRESTDGDIYFVRLNGLIKAGWSRDLSERLRAYGPGVEVLAHYPGTRDDETTLHRQLRPNLANGREWYHDNAAVQHFVREAIENHGPPRISAAWSAPVDYAAQPRRRGA